MEHQIVDKRIPEPSDFHHLQQPTEVVINDNVSMIISDGQVTFMDYTTEQAVTVSEWDLSEAELHYVYLRLEEKNPTIKANRIAREQYEAEQEQSESA